MADAAPIPAVSVVIPTYNRVHCLPRAIESVLRQTFSDLELIVVDDCSTDATMDYLRTIDDPRLRILRHDANRGGCAARNTGIAAARADLVAFQDSDDEWLVTKLARQVEAYRAADAATYGAVYCGKVTYGEAGHGDIGPRRVYYAPMRHCETVEGDLLLQLLRTPMISTQTLMVRKDLLEAIGGFDESVRIGQDWDLTVRLARVTRYLYLEEPLGLCFLEPDSISKAKFNLAAARQAMLARNIDVIARHPRLHADYLIEVARIYQRHGMGRRSLPFALQALGKNPLYRRGWLTLAMALLMLPRADRPASGQSA